MQWLGDFILRLFGKAQHQPGDGWSDLMNHYQQMNQKLELRIEHLESQIASIEAGLETEKIAHKECQKKLRAMEDRVSRLERRDIQRDTDHGGS